MAKSAEVDDPSQHAAPGATKPARLKNGAADASGVPPMKKYKRRAKVAEELGRWYSLNEAERTEELKAVIRGEARWSHEAMMHVARHAFAKGDHRGYLLAFNAFATRAAQLLMSQARKLKAGEQEDHAQEVLYLTAKDVLADKAEYAEANFADYALRKGIDLLRRVTVTLEDKLRRVEPTPADDEDGDASDPLDEVADRVPSPEARAMLKRAVGKLDGKLREVFIQYYVLRLTHEEIALHHDVDESTSRNWVKRAGELVGHQGGNDDDKG